MSYSQELDTSNYLCEEKNDDFCDFPNISFDSNISVEHINRKSYINQHVSAETQIIGPEKSEISVHSSTKIEKFNISFDSDDSIELLDLDKENCVKNSGIVILFDSAQNMDY